MDRVEQFREALPLPHRCRDDRNAKPVFKRLDIDPDPVTARLIHQVEADHDAVGDLEDLQHQVEVPLQPGRVHHHHGHVGIAKQDEVPGNLLIGAPRLE